MEEASDLGPRSKRMRLEAEEAERAPLNSQAREDVLARCNVGTSRGIVPETRALSDSIQRYHVVSHALTVRRVECREAWLSTLTKEEKLYGHYFSQAAWAGARVCAYQSSQESPAILSILCSVFSGESVCSFEKRSYEAGITALEWKYLGAFAACFFTNMGNYLAFGGTKFIPGISQQKFDNIINLCILEGDKKERLLSMWNSTKEKIYSLTKEERQLGIPPTGTSMYYHPSIRAKDITLVQEWMAQDGVEGWNTRIWRNDEEMTRDGLPLYQLRVASSLILPSRIHKYKDKCFIEIVYGDYREQMQEVVEHLLQAYEHGNGFQKEMITEFIEYFRTGSVDAHKRAQRRWVAVKDLPVESNIGFMETYRDPIGIRAEFEGFFATVDKDKSVKYARLVEVAEDVLRSLPWPSEFEKDVYHVPQFSSLTVGQMTQNGKSEFQECHYCYLFDMISFANSSIPVGINLPNYEDIRQEHGFKNVVLQNILSAHEDVGKVTFLVDGDQEVFEKQMQASLHIQIACHELLGHGSGKIFKRRVDGSHNFRRGEVMHPYTSEPVAQCYLPGQTFDSVFGSMSSAFEECRADCVGLFLSSNPKVLEIFGHTGDVAQDVVYVNWLLMVRAGLVALEFYNPKSGNWSQPHMQARYAILRVLLKASEAEPRPPDSADEETKAPFLQLVSQETDVLISLNRTKIFSIARAALGDFLCRLQVYKSTADVDSARSLLSELCEVPDALIALRRIVLVRKKPRPLLVQVTTCIDDTCDEGVRLTDYPETLEGVIESFVDRFKEGMLVTR